MPELIALIQQNSTIFIIIASLLGLVIGSFLNVVIHRLPIMMEMDWREQCASLSGIDNVAKTTKYNLITPRSICPHCQKAIAAWHNIPVISFLMLGGRCKECKASISWRYPAVEIISAFLVGLTAYKFGFSINTLAASVFALALLSLTFIDLDTQLLPDDITLPLLWLGLLFNLNGGFTDIQSAVIGAVAGYLILWSVYWLFKLITGKEGMGYGDFKMLGAIGAWFGWTILPAAILLSSIAGSIIGIGLIIFAKKGRNTAIPFGPYLALGGIAALFWGTQLSHLYLVG
ncbi:MAG: Type 4 prepilin-like protein leader peptide-processing enzyme : Leader peptidase [Pseudomonadota bacterium]|jgi:leader peptidase (prepilin peptidase)/N-methyltransferase